MAMKPCKKCGKNDWDYVKLDNDPKIYCTCKRCGYKLNFTIPKKVCQSCNRRTDFEKIDISKDERGKKCLLCGYVKILPVARAEFRTVNGIGYRLEEDGLWHEVRAVTVPVKGGTALWLKAMKKVLIEEEADASIG